MKKDKILRNFKINIFIHLKEINLSFTLYLIGASLIKESIYLT